MFLGLNCITWWIYAWLVVKKRRLGRGGGDAEAKTYKSKWASSDHWSKNFIGMAYSYNVVADPLTQ
jgi:hypothetical protein